MQNTELKETKKPLKLKKVSLRDLDETSFGASRPQVSTIMGCNTTGETCIHHCAQQ
jgi:hypothetical protein